MSDSRYRPRPTIHRTVLAYGVSHALAAGLAAWHADAAWAWATAGPWLSSAVRVPILVAAVLFAEILGLVVLGSVAQDVARPAAGLEDVARR